MVHRISCGKELLFFLKTLHIIIPGSKLFLVVDARWVPKYTSASVGVWFDLGSRTFVISARNALTVC